MRFHFYPKEYAALTRLGVPILIAQVGFTLQGMADTIMVGQHHAQELSAVGFVNSIMVFAIILSMGFSQGAVAVIGSLYTQGKNAEIAEVLKSSIVSDGLQMLLLTAVMTIIYFCLPVMGLDPELLPLMQSYYLILLPSLLIFAFSSAFKPFADSINDTKVSMWILLASNVWNILFNWLLIFGNPTLHIPEMGIEGAAYATATSRLLMLVLFLFVVFGTRRYESYMKHWGEAKVTWKRIVQLNKLGWPIGVQMSFEIAAFAGVSLILGWGGKSWDAASALASHQVMNSIASLIYMFYVGIGTAIAIRVANYHGLNDNHGVRSAANAGYHLILLTGIIASTLVFGFRHELARLFVNAADAEMFKRVSEIVAATTIPVILYQFGDGLQTAYVNALRGYGEVKVLMKYSFLAYVVISIPMSYFFGVVMDWGCFGIWMGMPFGLTIVGVLYYLRFRKITKHHEPTRS
jgi:MATE family multidrug resistance protein